MPSHAHSYLPCEEIIGKSLSQRENLTVCMHHRSIPEVVQSVTSTFQRELEELETCGANVLRFPLPLISFLLSVVSHSSSSSSTIISQIRSSIPNFHKRGQLSVLLNVTSQLQGKPNIQHSWPPSISAIEVGENFIESPLEHLQSPRLSSTLTGRSCRPKVRQHNGRNQ